MDRVNLIEMLAQAENDMMEGVFEDFIRGAARYAFIEAMSEEVAALCGPRGTDVTPSATATAREPPQE